MGKLKSFRSFSEQKLRSVVVAMDAFHVPSLAHEKLLERVSSLAVGNHYAIFIEDREGPLSYDEKIKYLRKIFPRHGRNIIEDRDISSMKEVVRSLHDQGYNRVTFVCSDQMIRESCLRESRDHSFEYGVSIVDIDPIDDRLIESAQDNSLEKFSKYFPQSFVDCREMLNCVRAGMGLKETHSFRKHIPLEPISETREAYIQGQLFSVNDRVNIIGTELSGIVSKCGPNYIIVEASDGKSYRKWLHSVEKI